MSSSLTSPLGGRVEGVMGVWVGLPKLLVFGVGCIGWGAEGCGACPPKLF